MSDPGEVAYSAYKEFARGVSLLTGDALPEWSALKESIKDAWRHAASVVRQTYGAIY